MTVYPEGGGRRVAAVTNMVAQHDAGDAVMLEGMDAGVSFRSVHDPATATTGKRCRNSELKDLGWEPAYPSFREGYTSVLANL